MAEKKPAKAKLGDWVVFVHGARKVPAIVTDPDYDSNGAQALTVFPVNDAPFATIASYDANASGATWHKAE